MTQVATSATVVAPFDGVNLKRDGEEYALERRGDRVLARMPPVRRGKRVLPAQDRSVVMAAGSHYA